MKGSIALAFGLVIIGVAWMSGCGTSSAGNNSTTTTGNTAITSCTTTSSGAAQTCIPGLGTYGSSLYCSSAIAVSNTQQGKNLIGSMPQYKGYPIPSGTVINANSGIQILLTTGSAGPTIQTTLYVGGLPITGYSIFKAGTSSNPNVGTVELQPLATAVMPVDVISFAPWDGSVLSMPAVTININNVTFGLAALSCQNY